MLDSGQIEEVLSYLEKLAKPVKLLKIKTQFLVKKNGEKMLKISREIRLVINSYFPPEKMLVKGLIIRT